MIPIKNLLVATDFGATSDAALQYGREFARTFGARLRLLHVADCVNMIYGGETYTVTLPELQGEVEDEAKRQLDRLLTAHDRASLHAIGAVVTAVNKAEAIVTYSKVHDIDVIVMGTHGRGAVGHLFMGSVAEHVVRTANCPVLTVHQIQHDCIVPDSLVAVARA
jgi:nucleotide-binding universal stress UspA family protein